MTEVYTIELSDETGRLSEIKYADFTARREHAMNLAQACVVIGQVAKTECRSHEVELCVGQRQSERIRLDPDWIACFRFRQCPAKHGVCEIDTVHEGA